MAEWPMLYCVEHRGNPDDGEFFRHIEVIPAEIGRELYEALGEMEIPPFSRQLEALARYEREVGK